MRMRSAHKMREGGVAAHRTRFALAAALLAATAFPAMFARAAPALDYEFFKLRVQPIFLQKREGHTRCYVCHAESNNAFRLERLSPGASTWNEEQSRRNFEMASILVNPGAPAPSRLLHQPLAPEAAGTGFPPAGGKSAPKA